MPTSEPQKRANKKWRENNRERYNNICKEAVRIHYINNKDAISLYKHNLRIYKLSFDFENERKIFLKILL